MQAGQTIAGIEDTSRVEVRCSLRKEDLDFLPDRTDEADPADPANAYRLPPVPVTIRYARAGREYEWQGILSRQDGLGMDERTRTMPVRILVEDPQACKVNTAGREVRPIALVRGMFVHVDLHCTPDRPLLAIPEETIRPGKTVWLMRDQQLVIQPIHIVRIEAGKAYVDARQQLTRQHSIISSPVPGAKDGLTVTAAAAKPRGEKNADGRRGGLNKAASKDELTEHGKEAPGNRTGRRASREES